MNKQYKTDPGMIIRPPIDDRYRIDDRFRLPPPYRLPLPMPKPGPIPAPEEGETGVSMQQLKQQISEMNQTIQMLDQRIAKLEEFLVNTEDEGKQIMNELKKMISLKSKKPLIDSEHKDVGKDKVAQKILFG